MAALALRRLPMPISRMLAPLRATTALRAMSSAPTNEKGSIPDVEGLAGRARQEAMYKKAYGEELFDREASFYAEEGTRENPIPILSVDDSRIVGISLPDDATTRWFTLKAGELSYDPNTNNYFALKKVNREEVDEWVARAEKQVLGTK